MSYTKTNWANNSSPKINADNLNNMENGIKNNEISIDNTKGFIIWQNEDTSASITTETITLNTSDYDMYEILYRYSSSTSSTDLITTGKIPKGSGTRMQLCYASGNNLMIRDRNVTYVDATHLTIGENIGNDSVPNAIIPYYVIGYKIGLFEEE